MRIVLITPTLDVGGAQRSLAYLAQALSKRHEVTLFLFDGANVAYDPGCEVAIGPKVEGHLPHHKLERLMRRVIAANRLKRKVDAEVSISFLEGADYVNIASRHRDKCVLSIRGSKRYDQNIQGPVGKLRRHVLLPWALQSADAVVALSHGVAQELDDDYGVRRVTPLSVIHNFIDVDAVRQQAHAPLDQSYFDWVSERFVVAHARLEPEKGLTSLIPVVARLRQKSHPLGLLLVGDGSEAGPIASLGREHGLRVDVRPEGPVPPRSVGGPDIVITGSTRNPMPFVARAQVFAMTSTHEGFGNSLLEALALGVPALASDCPYGPREVLRAGTPHLHRGTTDAERGSGGLLLPRLSGGNRAALDTWCDAVVEASTDGSTRTALVAAAKQRALDFDGLRFAHEWEAVCARVLDEANRSGES